MIESNLHSKINHELTSFIVKNKKILSEDNNQSNNLLDVDYKNIFNSYFGDDNPDSTGLSRGKFKTLPYCLNHYKLRLSSFKFCMWTISSIPPSLCARFGWYLKEKNLLECVTCRAVVCSSLPPYNKVEAYKKFVEILRDRLKCGHHSWCGWQDFECPSLFIHPPLEISTSDFTDLCYQVVKISSIGASLPFVITEEMEGLLELEMTHLDFICSRPNNSLSESQITAAFLVLCGWVFESNQKLKCNLCMRSVGLWNFLPLVQKCEFLDMKEKDDERIEMNREREQKQQRIKQKMDKKRLTKEQELEAELKAASLEEKLREEQAIIREAIAKLTEFENKSVSSLIEKHADSNEICEAEEVKLLSSESSEIGGSLTNDNRPDDVGKISECTASSEQKKSQEDSSLTEHKVVELTSTENELIEPDSAESEKHEFSDLISFPKNYDDSYISSGDNEEENETQDDELWLEAVSLAKDSSKAKSSSGSSDSEDADEIDNAVDSKRSSKRSRENSGENSCNDLWMEAVACTKDSPDNSPSKENDENSNTQTVNSQRGLKRLREDLDEAVSGTSNIDSTENEIVEDESRATKIARFTDEEVEKLLEDGAAKEEDVDSNEGASTDVFSESEDDKDDVLLEEDPAFLKMKKKLFHPIEQHRHWCGWVINYGKMYFDEIVPSLPGYKILPPQIREMMNLSENEKMSMIPKIVDNIEGLREVRRILDSWTLPELTQTEHDQDNQ